MECRATHNAIHQMKIAVFCLFFTATALFATGLTAMLLAFQITLLGAAETRASIDRHALVTRHNIEWNDAAGQIPLGNGEFCFNADGTGLQTLDGVTVSHWGWHSDPLPALLVSHKSQRICSVHKVLNQ